MSQQSSEAAPILIVDDNSWMQRILAKILMSYGLKPSFASNAFDGIALAVEQQPQAIILDIVMPEINGLQTLRMLKGIKCTSHIPVLIITAAPDPKTLGQAVAAGAAGFIHKPFTRASIHDKLVRVLHHDAMPDVEQLNLRVSDDDLDTMLNSEKGVHLPTPSQHPDAPHNVHVNPVSSPALDSANAGPLSPEFTVTHRRVNVGVRRAAAEIPDDAELRELLKRSNHR